MRCGICGVERRAEWGMGEEQRMAAHFRLTHAREMGFEPYVDGRMMRDDVVLSMCVKGWERVQGDPP